MSEVVHITKNDALYMQIMEDLHDGWKPHSGQIEVARDFLHGQIDTLFLQMGRKWGKTEFAIYLLFRHALLNPGSACFYITPELSHGKELVWANMRLQRFLGKHAKKYIQGHPNNSELRIKFKNGSFIKIFGSENYGSANGLTPDFIVYDEMKIFHPRFHAEMNPNRLARNAKLVIIGTPPRGGERNRDTYIQFAEECKVDEDKRWYRRDSYNNPFNDPKWLEKEKTLLFNRGEQDVWFCEYEGRMVFGGKATVFPMFSRDRHVKPHGEILKEIGRDTSKLDWYVTADPGSTTCFATMFMAIHPYTKKIYILDELYETDQLNTSIRVMYPRMDSKMMEFYPNSSVHDDWCKTYDEAAAWFSTEVMHQYGVYFQPTDKYNNKKEYGLSLIKDQMLNDLVVISDRCVKLLWEIENYVKDENGKLPKKNDHLIDTWRYANSASNYSMIEVMENIKQQNDEDRRMYSMRHDMNDLQDSGNWLSKAMKGWFNG